MILSVETHQRVGNVECLAEDHRPKDEDSWIVKIGTFGYMLSATRGVDDGIQRKTLRGVDAVLQQGNFFLNTTRLCECYLYVCPCYFVRPFGVHVL